MLRWENIKNKQIKVFHLISAFSLFFVIPVSCCLLSYSPNLSTLFVLLWSISPPGFERWIQERRNLSLIQFFLFFPLQFSPVDPRRKSARKLTSPPPPPPYWGRSWMRIFPSLLPCFLLPLLPSASSLEGRAGGADGTGWADGDVITVRWEAGVWGRVRASVRGQRGRDHRQAGEATRRLRPKSFCCWCCYCCHRLHHLQRQRLHIRVASSSENLPLLIKRGGLNVGTGEQYD